MEKKHENGMLWIIIEVLLAAITVIGCMCMPNSLLGGESVLGLKVLGTLVLLEGVIVTVTLGGVFNNPDKGELFLINLNKLFSLLYLISIAAVWSDLAGISGEISMRNLILGGLWVTIYPMVSVIETTLDLLNIGEDI